jgi:dihydroorotase
MPNTDPVFDSVAALEELRRRTDRDALINVSPVAAISQGRRGTQPVDYDALYSMGAVGFSDDGESTRDSAVMLDALRASRRLGVPLMVHCEDVSLTGGSMHEGEVARRLGIDGLSPDAEEIIIRRDLALAAASSGWLHVCHVSTADGIAAISAAKARGVRVTAEVMPHHLLMTDDWVAGCRSLANVTEPVGSKGVPADPDTKVNPPLRTSRDAACLLDALSSGLIDVVATDHAPHARFEKQGRSYPGAAFGLSGSELALPLMLSLVRAGNLTMLDLVRFMSTAPARLWRLPSGSLRPGAPADIVAFDAEEKWTVSGDHMISRSANSPLRGAELQGRVKLTLLSGSERYREC